MKRRAFKFGAASSDRLSTCHPELVALAHHALRRSALDFGIICGARTAAEQRRLYDTGRSHLAPPAGRHLPQADGLSHALDFAPSGSAHYATDEDTDRALCRIAYVFNDVVRDHPPDGFIAVWGGNWQPLGVMSPGISVDALGRLRDAGRFVDAWHLEIRPV